MVKCWGVALLQFRLPQSHGLCSSPLSWHKTIWRGGVSTKQSYRVAEKLYIFFKERCCLNWQQNKASSVDRAWLNTALSHSGHSCAWRSTRERLMLKLVTGGGGGRKEKKSLQMRSEGKKTWKHEWDGSHWMLLIDHNIVVWLVWWWIKSTVQQRFHLTPVQVCLLLCRVKESMPHFLRPMKTRKRTPYPPFQQK